MTDTQIGWIIWGIINYATIAGGWYGGYLFYKWFWKPEAERKVQRIK